MPELRTQKQYVDLRGGTPVDAQFGDARSRMHYEARVRALRGTLRRGEFAVNVDCIVEKTTHGEPVVSCQRIKPEQLLDLRDRDGELVATGEQRFWSLVRSGQVIEGL